MTSSNMIGETIGHYIVTGKLGEGGMGTVYQARDLKLERNVAIKVLPVSFANDANRLGRFEHEAKVLACLNHPGIAGIYGVEDRALILELVPGLTLADRIAQGPISVEDTLDIACQLADALEYAHEHGVIHRDLKPANIKLDASARVKILDFGLAKAVSDPTLTSDDPDNSPTATSNTVAGTILGTAAYMAPEQARGRSVDKRADIWALGVVLWEMLTGKRLFNGESTVDILGKVLAQPIDLDLIPPRFRRLLARCLNRNPKERLRDIGEARFLLNDAPPDNPFSEQHRATAMPALHARLPWAIALVGIAVAAAVSFVHFQETPPEERVVRAMVLPPDKTTFAFASNLGPMELSPDGRRLVFAATGEDGKSQLWIRSLDTAAIQPLPGTEGGQFPFWSPDSLWVAFFNGGKLKKIDTRGGPPIEVADAPSGRGGSWSEKGVIVFAPGTKGVLLKVASTGGDSSPALVAEAAGINPRFPWFLPDGEHFLFEAYQREAGGRRVNLVVGSLNTRTSKIIGEADSNAVYAQGRLLYLRGNTLMEQPFDLKALRGTAEAVPVTERLTRVLDPGSIGAFSVSATGMLAYQAGAMENTQQLTWFDRTGKALGSIGEPRQFEDIEFSPDRKTLAAAAADPNGSWVLWMYNVARAAATRFTFDPADDLNAVWSPDGRTIAFTSGRNGHLDLYEKAADGVGEGTLLYSDEHDKHPTSWSPDGRFLLYLSFQGGQRNDLLMLPLTLQRPGEPRQPVPFLQTKFNERFGQFSPDGLWVAFDSDESERRQVYVAPASRPTEKHQISANGGIKPRWRSDGKEIFYQTPEGQLMATEVRIHGNALEVGGVHSLFGQFPANNGYYWDVSADGQRILAAAATETQKAPEPITLVENWAAAFKKQ